MAPKIYPSSLLAGVGRANNGNNVGNANNVNGVAGSNTTENNIAFGALPKGRTSRTETLAGSIDAKAGVEVAEIIH